MRYWKSRKHRKPRKPFFGVSQVELLAHRFDEEIRANTAMQSVIDRMRWWEANTTTIPAYHSVTAWEYRFAAVARYLEAQGL